MNRTLLIVALALVILAGGYGIASAADPPHQDYRLSGTPGYKNGSCQGSACHQNEYAMTRFLQQTLTGNPANDFTAFCLGCHSATGEAHDKSVGVPSANSYTNQTGLVPGGAGNSHSWNGSIGDAGTRVPLAGGFSGTTYMPGGKVRCQTCHDGMSKSDHEVDNSTIENIYWLEATSGDNRNFTILGYSNTKQYLSQYIRVFRSATVQTYNPAGTPAGTITESRGKKAFLANYTSYTYNYQTATITFNQAQASGIHIYAEIGQPYLRVGNQANAICVDCHNDRLSRSVTHSPGTGAKDGHPVMVPFGNRSGLHNTLKASASSNIFIEGGTVECTSCHDPHNAAGKDGMILRNADKNTLCTNCHAVKGYDGYTAAQLAMHNGAKHTSPTACADCHTTHNTNNIMLIKNKVNGVAINFQNFSGANNFVNGSGTGLCQVCHNSTDHYRADGSRQDHNVGRNCVACHGHNTGFQGGGCTGCHGLPPAPGNAGPSGWSDTTGNLHSSHMAHLAIAPYNLTGTAACGACHGSKPGSPHPENLNTAYIDLSAWGGTFSDGGTIGKTDTSDDTCSNVSCHGGGTRTWLSSTGSGGCTTCHNYPSATNDWSASNGHTIRSDVNFAHMAASGYDANTDTYATMVADTTRCGRCHPNDAGNHANGTINLNATGYAACGSGNFTINQTTTRSDVTCDSVLCHLGRTTPNWW